MTRAAARILALLVVVVAVGLAASWLPDHPTARVVAAIPAAAFAIAAVAYGHRTA